MSFNCVSKYGLVGGGVFLPYDIQKIISDIWLHMRYREMYDEFVETVHSPYAGSAVVVS